MKEKWKQFVILADMLALLFWKLSSKCNEYHLKKNDDTDNGQKARVVQSA